MLSLTYRKPEYGARVHPVTPNDNGWHYNFYRWFCLEGTIVLFSSFNGTDAGLLLRKLQYIVFVNAYAYL